MARPRHGTTRLPARLPPPRRGHVEDLLDMEFAYAPPYAPALDPLFSMGASAMNAMREGVTPVSPQEPLHGTKVVDVRRPHEIDARALCADDVCSIPLEEIRARCSEVPKDKRVTVVCEKGVRSSECVRILQESGCGDVVYVGGGLHMKAES